MRSFGWLTTVLVGLLALASRGVQAADPEMKPRTINEVDGKSLVQWTKELTNPDASIREEAIRAVVFFSGPHSHELITALIERCQDRGDVSVKVRAIMALTILEVRKEDIPRIVKAMGERLQVDTQVIVRFQAAVALVRFGEDSKDAMTALIKGATDQQSFEIRRMCIRALEACGYMNVVGSVGPDPRVTNVLLNALHDPASQVRQEAVIALGSMGRSSDPMLYSKTIDLLPRVSVSDRDKIVRIWALVSWMALDKPSELGIKRIVDLLKDPEQRVRLAAVRALGIMGTRGKTVVSTLIEMLNDKDPAIVVAACSSLAGLADGAAPALKALTAMSERKDIDKGMKALVDATIKQIKSK